MRWHSNATSYVRAYTNPGTTQSEKCTLAPRGPTRAVPLLVRVHCRTKDIVRGFKREQGQGYVGLDKRDRARMSQESHKGTVVRHGFTRHRRVPHTRIVALDGDHVLEGYRHASERTGTRSATSRSLS